MTCYIFMNECNRRNWTSEIKDLLCISGFGHVWYFQGAGNEVSFIQMFKERLTDIYLQTWRAGVSECDELRTYRSYNGSQQAKMKKSIPDIPLPWNL